MGTHHGGDGGELPPDRDHPDGPERGTHPEHGGQADQAGDTGHDGQTDDGAPTDDGGGPTDDGGGPTDNGGSTDDGAPAEEEWPEVDVPDDPSALDAEAARIRAELAEEQRAARRERRRERRAQWREQWRPADDPDGTAADDRPRGFAAPTVTLSLLVVSVAVLITLVSLFAMTWGPPRDGGGSGELPPVTLTDPLGRQVALTAETPAALVLVDGCSSCEQLVSATVAASPAEVRVAVVDTSAPPAPSNLAPGDAPPLRLADPEGVLRAELDLDQPGNDAATVVLVDGNQEIVQTVPSATSVAQYQGELTDLGRGTGTDTGQ